MEDVGDHDAFWTHFHPLHYSNATTLLGKAKKITKLPNDLKWPEIKTVLLSLVPACEKIAAVKQFIEKGRKPSESPANARTLDHTGTCGCCNRNVKLRPEGTMWDHGYMIGGKGSKGYSCFRVGSCFGVGYQPIEVSPEVWDAMLQHMHMRVAALPAAIDANNKWLAENPWTEENKKLVSAKQWNLREITGELKRLPREIKELTSRRNAWTARPLPQVKP